MLRGDAYKTKRAEPPWIFVCDFDAKNVDPYRPRSSWPKVLKLKEKHKGRVKIYRVPGPGPSTGGRRLFFEKN